MKFNVTEIEFDFEDSQGEIHPDDQYQTTYDHLGVWEAVRDEVALCHGALYELHGQRIN